MASTSLALCPPAKALAGVENQSTSSLLRTQSVKPPPCRRPRLICRSSMTSMPSDQAFEGYSSPNLALSFVSEEQGSSLDEEWLRLGLSFPSKIASAGVSGSESYDAFETGSGYSSSDLDDIWLKLGLTFTDTEPEYNTHLGTAPQVLTETAVEEKTSQEVVEPIVYDVNTLFSTDLRPIVLFDGTCNFCSKWTVFLLDTDPLGNLRFASMQSDAGKALLRRAGMSEIDNSEIVLAGHKRSYVGVEAILQIFQRLQMPFPIIAAIGGMMPLFVDSFVYKIVSKYRHKFGGPAACRLFDTRFNERFVS